MESSVRSSAFSQATLNANFPNNLSEHQARTSSARIRIKPPTPPAPPPPSTHHNFEATQYQISSHRAFSPVDPSCSPRIAMANVLGQGAQDGGEEGDIARLASFVVGALHVFVSCL